MACASLQRKCLFFVSFLVIEMTPLSSLAIDVCTPYNEPPCTAACDNQCYYTACSIGVVSVSPEDQKKLPMRILVPPNCRDLGGATLDVVIIPFDLNPRGYDWISARIPHPDATLVYPICTTVTENGPTCTTTTTTSTTTPTGTGSTTTTTTDPSGTSTTTTEPSATTTSSTTTTETTTTTTLPPTTTTAPHRWMCTENVGGGNEASCTGRQYLCDEYGQQVQALMDTYANQPCPTPGERGPELSPGCVDCNLALGVVNAGYVCFCE